MKRLLWDSEVPGEAAAPGWRLSQAALSSTGVDAEEGENVWTEPRLAIGQVRLGEKGQGH